MPSTGTPSTDSETYVECIPFVRPLVLLIAYSLPVSLCSGLQFGRLEPRRWFECRVSEDGQIKSIVAFTDPRHNRGLEAHMVFGESVVCLLPFVARPLAAFAPAWRLRCSPNVLLPSAPCVLDSASSWLPLPFRCSTAALTEEGEVFCAYYHQVADGKIALSPRMSRKHPNLTSMAPLSFSSRSIAGS
jgi:hypothetical protein